MHSNDDYFNNTAGSNDVSILELENGFSDFLSNAKNKEEDKEDNLDSISILTEDILVHLEEHETAIN